MNPIPIDSPSVDAPDNAPRQSKLSVLQELQTSKPPQLPSVNQCLYIIQTQDPRAAPLPHHWLV
jgi:hypothetical protein